MCYGRDIKIMDFSMHSFLGMTSVSTSSKLEVNCEERSIRIIKFHDVLFLVCSSAW